MRIKLKNYLKSHGIEDPIIAVYDEDNKAIKPPHWQNPWYTFEEDTEYFIVCRYNSYIFVPDYDAIIKYEYR